MYQVSQCVRFICEFLFTFACFISYLSFILLASFLIRLSFFIALCFIHSIAYPLLCVLICVSYSFYCIFQMFHSICVASFHFPLSVGSQFVCVCLFRLLTYSLLCFVFILLMPAGNLTPNLHVSGGGEVVIPMQRVDDPYTNISDVSFTHSSSHLLMEAYPFHFVS